MVGNEEERGGANTVWISDAASNSFWEGGRHHVLLEMEAIGLFIDAFSDAVSLEHLFQIFVENEMDHRLRYAEIGRTDAFIESQKSLEERREDC